MRVDQYQQMNYEMVLSDFVIGNNNNPILMDTTVNDTTSTIKSTTSIKRKLPILRKNNLTVK